MKCRHVVAALILPMALVAAGCTDDEESGSGSEGTEANAPAEGGATEGGATEGEAAAAADPMAVIPMGSPPAADADTSKLNIAQIATGTGAVSTLTQLVVKGGLVATLRDGGPFTVFAPVNEAFAELPPETYFSVVHDDATLTSVLTLHVVPGIYASTDLMDLDGQTLTTVQGGKLLVEMDGDDVIVGGARVVAPDIDASNGVIHAIDMVIAAPNG